MRTSRLRSGNFSSFSVLATNRFSLLAGPENLCQVDILTNLKWKPRAATATALKSDEGDQENEAKESEREEGAPTCTHTYVMKSFWQGKRTKVCYSSCRHTQTHTNEPAYPLSTHIHTRTHTGSQFLWLMRILCNFM